MRMLQIKNLTVTHRRDYRVIIDNFSMVLNDGDKAALIGEEGNGKSTLLKLISSAPLAEAYADYTGEIIRNGARIGYLGQELLKEQLSQTVYEFFAQSEEFNYLTPKESADTAAALYLPADFFYSDQKVCSLSGGEKVKLQMARLLMEKPDILCLDEPSNDIDLKTLEWLETFINETALPVLYISHDETLLRHTANKIIHFEQIQKKTRPRHTVAAMGYDEYIKKRGRDFARQKQAAGKERSEYEKKQEKFRKIQQKVEHQQNAITRQDPHGGRLLKKKMHAVKAMGRRFEKESLQMTEFPEAEESIFIKFSEKTALAPGKRVLDFYAAKLMAGERVLSQDIRLSVTGPEHICITGRNGAGKTTLIKKIARELLEQSGLNVFYMPQNYEELLGMEQTPVRFLSESESRKEEARIRTYLGSMKFSSDEMEHPAGMLSGGQKAKLLLLKASMQGCSVLILDEPTRNLSPLSGPVIRSLLKNYQGAVISVSHDREYLKDVCSKVYELTRYGLVCTDGY